MTNAPFRADQVGSLLRPAALADARRRMHAGALDPAELAALEDRAIADAVARQEAVGLQSVTDGEFRRDWWHLDFLSRLDGVTLQENPGPKFRIAGQEQPPIATVTGKVACSAPIMASDFAHLKSVTTRTPKMTIPSPSMLHLRGGRAAISAAAYPDLAEFWADTAAAYCVAIRHLYDAGCRYLRSTTSPSRTSATRASRPTAARTATTRRRCRGPTPTRSTPRSPASRPTCA